MFNTSFVQPMKIGVHIVTCTKTLFRIHVQALEGFPFFIVSLRGVLSIWCCLCYRLKGPRLHSIPLTSCSLDNHVRHVKHRALLAHETRNSPV